MDPATLIGIGLAFVAIFGSMILEGGNPASILLLPAAAPRVRRHHRRRHGRRHHEGRHRRLRPRSRARSLARSDVRRRAGRHPRLAAERARREGLLALEETVKDGRRPVPAQGPRAGHRRHRPRGAARDPGGRGRTPSRTPTRPAPSSSPTWAATRRPSASSAPSSAWCTCWRTCPSPSKLGHLIAGAFVATLWGVHDRQRHLAADRQPAQAGQRARVRTRWSWSSRASWPSRPAPTRGWSRRSCASFLPPPGSGRERPRRRPDRGRARHAKRRCKRTGQEEHENHERWLVTYADMITLLMVLFIVMFAISQVDLDKFRR